MNWAFVGASTIAANFMIGAVRAQGGQVGWLVSGAQARGQDYAQRHGIARFTTDLDAALGDPGVTAVYISTTNDRHFDQGMAAIAAGKHVLCEKPLALRVAQAAQMVRAAAAKGVVFATNHHLRCAGSHRVVRDLISDGRIGQVLSLRLHHAVFLPPDLQGWRIRAVEGGGVIADITVHDADCVRFLMGEDPVSVVAQAGSSGMGQGVEDQVMSLWSLPSGAMVMAHESFTHGHAGTGLEVHGTKGSIFARGVMTQRPLGEVELVTDAGREIVAFPAHDLYGQGVADFVGAVAGRGQVAADGWDGVASLAVAEAVRAAAHSGQRQIVDHARRS